MSEAADRPTAPAPLPAPAPPAWADSLSRPEGEEPYRPLSIPAVAGLALAALYAGWITLGGLSAFHLRFRNGLWVALALAPVLAVLGAALVKVREPQRLARVAAIGTLVLIGGLALFSLVAFSGSNPWLVPGWTLVLPVAAALVCYLARLQIQRSEGTLAGLGLTTWGLGLSLVFGLNYGAYRASTFFAVRQQASSFAEEWLGDVQQGNLGLAFLKTQPPGAFPRDAEPPRDALEARFNQGGPGHPGAYSTFIYSDSVRFLTTAGPGARFELISNEPVYENDKNSYLVTLVYRVHSETGEARIGVRLRSYEPVGQQEGGRRWQAQGARLLEYQPSEMALARNRVIEKAVPQAVAFAKALEKGNLAEAYVLTRPAAERRGDEKGENLPPAAAVLAKKAGPAAYRDFLQGGLIRTDGKASGEAFWAHDRFRDALLTAVKSTFSPGKRQRLQILLLRAERDGPPGAPVAKLDGDRARAVVLFQLVSSDPGPVLAPFAVDAAVVLEGTGDDLRVVALELLRAQTVQPSGKES
jgi:hypothetical protein